MDSCRPGRRSEVPVAFTAFLVLALVFPCQGVAQQASPARSSKQAKPKQVKGQPAAASQDSAVQPTSIGGMPESFLQIDPDAKGRSDLAVKVGEAVRFGLALPTKEQWNDANIGMFHIRTFGRQESVKPKAKSGTRFVEHVFDKPGWALVLFGAGDGSEKGKSDSWQRTQYCAKMVVRVDDDRTGLSASSQQFADPGVTGKVGMKIELLPYMFPPGLTFSSSDKTHMPVRAYWEGASQKNATIHAYGSNGDHLTAKTGGKGIANIEITGPGRWLLRYQKVVDGVTYTGDLVFDVPKTNVVKGGGR